VILALILAAATSVHLAVTTASPQAQASFDRGLFLYYAFDRDGAAAAFETAAGEDPHLAMAYWGVALADGPDLNNPLTSDRFERAKAAIERAGALERNVTPHERAYIDAMALRYRGTWNDWQRDDDAYRRAMEKLAAASGDENAKLLTAEALLEHGGMLWNGARPATDDSRTILASIASVLAADPSNPMANHLCIHAYDYAPDRSPALPCAQRLDAAAFPPHAEHLAHVPAHYWTETGEYGKAVASSERAYQLLLRWDALAHRPLTAQRYASHDVTVGYAAAMMLGNYQDALTWSARMDAFFPWKYESLTALRFARYDLAFEAPATGIFEQIVRGLAALHLGRLDAARSAAREIEKESAGTPKGYLAELFMARLTEAQGKTRAARSWLQQAQDTQHAQYGAELIPEIPAEEALGGFLLRAHDADAAVTAFQACLDAYPNDPRALFGLAAALQAQGHAADAAQTRTHFMQLWKGADTTLTIDDF